ncbi:hypothetical protein WJX72_004570 [[Myrmecia] bisecta]|uniref:Dihydrolipoamide acetyltransferase component of pyruvate dehydrogenase complex n=1 Tax=[Myrmecia] bisecta TaxID=41462 RepID=A0AAW1PTM6_9CHLO
MPALSPTLAQGNVASWNVKEGDDVAPGDMLADIETDKATLGWENMDDGFIAKILVPAGTKDVAVGTPLALLVEDADSVPAFKDYKGSASAGSSADSNAKPASADAEAAAASTSRPHGTITKGDVLAAIQGDAKPKPLTQAKEDARPSEPQAAKPQTPAASPSAAQAAPAPKPQPGARYTDTSNSQIRKIIAQRLLESKTKIPHAYFSATANIDGVAALRQTLKEQGQKVSVNDFVIRATALALQEVPAAKAFWDEVKEDIKPADSIDIAIAVATDNGLITPIVAKANTKSLMQISAEVRELAARTHANKLKPHEFQGGSFSISNLGMYGVDRFEAIINPPQACIMAQTPPAQLPSITSPPNDHAAPYLHLRQGITSQIAWLTCHLDQSEVPPVMLGIARLVAQMLQRSHTLETQRPSSSRDQPSSDTPRPCRTIRSRAAPLSAQAWWKLRPATEPRRAA